MEFGLRVGDIKVVNEEGKELEVGKMIPAANYNKIMDLLGQLQTELNSVHEERKIEWFDTKDELVIECTEFMNDRIEIECNYENWSVVKTDIEKFKYPMMVEVYENDDTSLSVGLTLNQMKLLRDYLNHKIEYIEN